MSAPRPAYALPAGPSPRPTAGSVPAAFRAPAKAWSGFGSAERWRRRHDSNLGSPQQWPNPYRTMNSSDVLCRRWSNETSFQTSIIRAAKQTGWLVFHDQDSRMSEGRGFPDLVLARAGRPLILAELKMPNRHPSPFQKTWIRVLGMIPGIEVHLWYPRDWDRIIAKLK